MPGNRNFVFVIFIAAFAVAAGGIILILSRPKTTQVAVSPPRPTATHVPTSTPEPISVYITGAVNSPQQTLTLPHNSRVQDAIDAAGGLDDNADLNGVNLAGVLRDGDQVHVPAIGAETVTAPPTPSGGGLVNVNSATSEELQSLPGIGPATAEAIIAYRNENGAFSSLEALDAVSGIGPALLGKISELVVFE